MNIELKTEKINLEEDHPLPRVYACQCKYCVHYGGMLIRPDRDDKTIEQRMYNRNDRRKYYEYNHGGGGGGHINTTPLHVARWAIQTYTEPEELVLDPFCGSGTTLVEAMNHSRRGMGFEIDTHQLAERNIHSNRTTDIDADVFPRDIRNHSENIPEASLIILHPPYSGDEQSNAKYDRTVNANLAFLKESTAYWDAMKEIVTKCTDNLREGGHVVIGIKEMMKNKQWWNLHEQHSDVVRNIPGMKFKQMVLLPHYPKTLHLNTYYTRYGIHPSYWQTITVFEKEANS